MSEFHVRKVTLGEINDLPDSDILAITLVDGPGGYPVIVRRSEYKSGDQAVYIPIDAIVPEHPRFAFLGEHRRIKARKLRGVFSMGLLVPDDGSDPETWGIVKYEPSMSAGLGFKPGTDDDSDEQGVLPTYTDIEGLRRHSSILTVGEEVIITEKIHGESLRAINDGSRLHVGSRTRFKKDRGSSQWWQAVRPYAESFAHCPGYGFFGECHGYTGGFPYGTGRKPTMKIFDAMNAKTFRYLDYSALEDLCDTLSLPMVPVLYRGPWHEGLRDLANGQSTLDPTHIREGIVIRPIHERTAKFGRVILKLHGEAFLLKTGK